MRFLYNDETRIYKHRILKNSALALICSDTSNYVGWSFWVSVYRSCAISCSILH